jgi:Ankyrin repeats (many copies)
LYQAITQTDGIPTLHLQDQIRTQRNIGFYPLHIAASHGYMKLTEWLINNHKVKIDEIDKFGNLALHIALESNHSALAVYFIERAPLASLFAKNEYGKSVFKLSKDHCPKAKLALMERMDYIDKLLKSIQNENQLKQAVDFLMEAIENAPTL